MHSSSMSYEDANATKWTIVLERSNSSESVVLLKDITRDQVAEVINFNALKKLLDAKEQSLGD